MAANTQPIFTKTPNLDISIWTSSLTGNTKSDGTGTIGTDMVKAVTGATEGTYVEKLRFIPQGSVAGTTLTASVIRIYVSTVGSGSTTRTDTTLLHEISVAANTIDNATSGVNYFEVLLGLRIKTGQFIHWSMHHAAASNTSWGCVPFAGDY